MLHAFAGVGEVLDLEHGADAEGQVLHVERFADEVVGARGHGFLQFFLHVERGDDDDGRVPGLFVHADGLAERDAIEVWHTQVEENQIRLAGEGEVERVATIGSRQDRISFCGKNLLEEALHVGIVLNDEYRIVAHMQT